jgi:hypothetical protein
MSIVRDWWRPPRAALPASSTVTRAVDRNVAAVKRGVDQAHESSATFRGARVAIDDLMNKMEGRRGGNG